MAPSRSRIVRFFARRHGRGGLVLGVFAAVLLAGCQEERIEHYTAAKADNPPPMAAPVGRSAGRMLGLILPHNDLTWFFKLVGRSAEIDEHKEDFDRFLHSIEFSDGGDPPIKWEVPDDWRKTASPKGRFATFRMGAKDAGSELTIYFFANGPQTSDVLANVNRWRSQLGLPDITKDEIGQYISDPKLKAGPSTFVDLTSRLPAVGPRAGGEAKPNLKYDKPEGWKEQRDPKGIRLVVFEIKQGDKAAEAGISVFPGDGGGILMNVNRWRGQIGLPAAGEEQLAKDLKRIEVDGTSAQAVDLNGIEMAGRPRLRLIGVMVARGERTWFFTLKGPDDVVGAQKAAFDAFLASVRFEEGKGAK